MRFPKIAALLGACCLLSIATPQRLPAAEPHIRFAGYQPVTINGEPRLLFIAVPQWQNRLGKVQLLYEGLPTGISLWDDGTDGDAVADDGVYSYLLPRLAGAGPLSVALELQASEGTVRGPVWPHLTVNESGPEWGCLKQVNEDGFGGRNFYSWAMTTFKDRLYVGTLNGRAGVPVIFDSFRAMDSDGTEIWRYDGTSWERAASGGFGDNPDCFGTRNLIEHNGRIYAGTANLTGGCEVWESSSGSNWRPIMRGGWGKPENQSVRGFLSHDGKLYVGVENSAQGCELWRWDGSTWENLVEGGFGDTSNRSVAEITYFQNKIWLLLWNLVGYQVYTLDPATDTITQVVGPNAPVPPGNGDALNQGVLSSAVYNGKLYIGTVNIFTGADMYVTEDGRTWRQLVDRGFGYTKQAYIWWMKEYRGKLYLGCYTLGEGASTFQEAGRMYMMDEDERFTELVGPSGVLAPAGIVGNVNYGIRSLEVFRDRLYLGTAQCFFCDPVRPGTQVWEYDLDCR